MAAAMTPSKFDALQEVPVLFEEHQFTRTYVMNRPKALNALNEEMIDLMRPKLDLWNYTPGCKIIIGTGKGRAFCAGGDVRAVVKHASEGDASTRAKAAEYFRKEFELDYLLANLRKPYVAVLDGITMGGGLGLSVHAPFRVATENAQFAMPETKIGYAPDVGATYFLPKLDGCIGAYLALTGNTIKGREVYELGLATHFVPSERIPKLLERLAQLNPPDFDAVNAAIEEYAADDYSALSTDLVGEKRRMLDKVFGQETVELIVEELRGLRKREDSIAAWAVTTLEELELRSPTALKVALEAYRAGKGGLTLREALLVELRFATAFCNGASPDFITGVKAVLEDKIKGRPTWEPSTLKEVTADDIWTRFFSPTSPFTKTMPKMDLDFVEPLNPPRDVMHFALPSEKEIGRVIRGEEKDSGAFAVTAEDVVRWFADKSPGKPGVAAKVREVLERKARTKKDGYLQWIH
ncbi:ClpP/crotonase [Dacryopinax primogenitus]|uniref:3-hydroxyisobutyryl-CoA hydrolase n=1 Tax=Dacryopinax primogenitus (strain DJM 731) TaxID=1858805 RepID=M5FT59_DACPD|nr:ClpP/crotonase [Dacryopinax primogenitus]EJU00771.1 ClpP/crotonase [Dacryopinax primogenitus]